MVGGLLKVVRRGVAECEGGKRVAQVGDETKTLRGFF